MRTLTRETYYCDFCNKLYLSKYFCHKHEVNCSKNPENHRDCFSCAGCTKTKAILSDCQNDLNESLEVQVFYCSFIDIYVTPPKAERNGNIYHLDKQNIFMPKKCNAKQKFSDVFLNDPF